MMRIALIPAAVLLFASCTQEERAPVDSDVTASTGMDRSLADETKTGPTRARDLTEIPERFRGVWDYGEGDCMASSELRLDIGQREIEFYESVGEIRSLSQGEDGSIVLGLAMSGEGETWEQQTRLSLSEDGERLTIEDAQNPREEPTNVRRRCEA
ncbi:hypothetical protein [Qipengyuania atrilutea]|uniref:Lipoprotein n=1 Tax=Qipengyuania atrilutea TaxID=2744473 RepID=A0A850H4W7_9SPHN|nr:hypothetical protein [Actirhodobacter atriluteus]NVD45547.1 hypothetical protein [Actirhodobacter atriluteus]